MASLTKDFKARGYNFFDRQPQMAIVSNNLPVPPSPTSTNLKVGMSSPVVILKLNQISAIFAISYLVPPKQA